MPRFNFSELDSRFIIGVASMSLGCCVGYVLHKYMASNETLAEEIVRRTKKDPEALKPIIEVLSFFSQGWRPQNFPGPQNGAPGLFVTPFKPSLNGGVAHVICKQGDQYFYLLNLQKRRGCLVADLPAGFSNSGDAAELARTQYMIEKLAPIKKQGDFKAYRRASAQLSSVYDATTKVEIDLTLEETVRRECQEETGLPLTKPGNIFNILTVNSGSHIIIHARYLINAPVGEDLPNLKPEEQEGIAKSVWVNINDIHATEAKIDGIVYPIKAYDLIAKHMQYVIQDLLGQTPAPLPNHFADPSYETKTFGCRP